MKTPRRETAALLAGAVCTAAAFLSLAAYDGRGWEVLIIAAVIVIGYANVAQSRRYRRMRRSR